jgi:outer membrane protein TolC
VVACAVAVVMAALAAPVFAQERAAPAPPAPTAEKVTLAQAVQRALARNPTVAIASAEIARAEALVRQARSGWTPTLNGNLTFLRLDHDRMVNGAVQQAANELGGNLVLTVPLVQAPAWTNTRHAQDNRRIAEASALDVRRQVGQATARAYLTVVAQHRLIAAAETARANAKDH